MAIVPKRKHSQARRDKRRSNVWKLEVPTLVKCSQCGELKVPIRFAASVATTKARKSSRKRRKSLRGGRCLPHFCCDYKECGSDGPVRNGGGRKFPG